MKNKIINPYTFYKNKNTQLMPKPITTQPLITKPISNLIAATSPLLKLAKESIKIGSNLPGYLGLGFSLTNLLFSSEKNNKGTNGEKLTESSIPLPKTITETANSQNNSLAN